MRIKWAVNLARMREMIGKHEGKRSLGRTSRTWQNNNKINFKGTKWEATDWIYLT
jgi:hypothetical protein